MLIISFSFQGVGKRSITLYDIRNELNCRYKDFRDPYRPPTADEKFEMVTKTHPIEFNPGRSRTFLLLSNICLFPKPI